MIYWRARSPNLHSHFKLIYLIKNILYLLSSWKSCVLSQIATSIYDKALFNRSICIPGLKESIKADLCNRIEYEFLYYVKV